MRKDTDRLRDVLEAVAAIERQAGPGPGRFDSDELVWAVVERDLAPLKEAIASILRSEGEEP